MSKQTEIKEGMRKIVEFCGNEPDVCVGELEMYLDKMGAVIKGGYKHNGKLVVEVKVMGDTFTAVEPLIKDKLR